MQHIAYITTIILCKKNISQCSGCVLIKTEIFLIGLGALTFNFSSVVHVYRLYTYHIVERCLSPKPFIVGFLLTSLTCSRFKFCVFVPKLWSSNTPTIRFVPSSKSFKTTIKTNLYSLEFVIYEYIHVVLRF